MINCGRDPDYNTAERAFKLVTIGRKNWMFAGFEGSSEAMAIACTLIETAKLNNVDPQAWPIVRPSDGHRLMVTNQ